MQGRMTPGRTGEAIRAALEQTPPSKYTCEVFDSEGTLAIMRTDRPESEQQSDAVYVTRLRDENDDDRPFMTTDEEYQTIIDAIVAAVEAL